MNTHQQPQDVTRYQDLVRALTADGWIGTFVPRPNPQTLMICPNQFLRMTLERDTANNTIHSTISTVTASPARWRAAGDTPPPALWLGAARAAVAALYEIGPRPRLYPGAYLKHHGWTYTQSSQNGALTEHHTSQDGHRSLTHRHSRHNTPAAYTITRPETSITITVNTPDPYALPALILALALDTPNPATTR